MKYQTINPATEEPIKDYQTMSKEDVMSIIDRSSKAQQEWKALSYQERGKHLLKLGEVLKQNKEEYATIMATEMGKPITEAIAEVEKCAWLCEVLAEKAAEWLSEESVEAGGKKHTLTFEPLGTIFIIMPWNFPFWQPLKVGLPPIMAGNTIILKHAKNVSGCSQAVEDAFKKAGFPDSILRSILVDHSLSEDILAHDNINGCSLTGSVGAGSTIASLAGKHLKKMVLELGGSDPFIVLEDADVDKAVQGAVAGRMLNSGQVCINAKRFIVHSSLAEEFAKKFAEGMSALKIGDPLDPETKVGPLVDNRAVEQMEGFVKDAQEKGATVLTGGKRIEGKGFYFEPTVLSHTTKEMNAIIQEVFGPVAPVITFETEEEAISLANNSEFGLSSNIYSQNQERAENIARRLNTGGVFINSVSRSHPLVPFGGVKKSGYGRELSHYGIKEFVNIKPINVFE